MWNQWLQLICMLFLILIASQLFTNALEYVGQKIKISTGVTGSIFAAIATALPETSVPIIAIVAGTPNKLINQQISVGAILGSSLMLSTLSTCLLGLSAIKKRGINGRIRPEKTGFTRDIHFFLISFFLAAMAMFVPYKPLYWRLGMSFALVSFYIIYLILTLSASKKLVSSGHGVVTNEPMIFTKFGLKNNASTIVVQLIIGLMLLLIGAKGFIDGVESISVALHVSALVLSLLIIPIATELPEKVNSILWVRKNQDTLGFGNITGAMVFQGTLLPALGILLTPWQPSREVLTGMLITLLAALWLRLNASSKGLRIMALLVNGSLYLIYLFFIF
jgi:cation:H+ antiporter